MRYYVLFGDEDREEKDYYPYESGLFTEEEAAKAWARQLPCCMDYEVIGYDASTNAYEVIEMN